MNVLIVARSCNHRREEGLAEGSGCLSCDSHYAVAVYTVGGNLVFKHHVSQTQDPHCIVTGNTVLGEQVDAAFRGIRIHIPVSAQLFDGAHHSKGLHAS